MCQHCHQEENQHNSSFLFGLVIGAIIAALAAIIIYKNRRSDVFTKLRDYLEKLFSPFLNPEPQTKTESKASATSSTSMNKVTKAKKPKAATLPKTDTQGKIIVELPKNLKTYKPASSSKKPAKMFRKPKA